MKSDAEIKAMLGELSPVELKALRESIEVEGVREPITLWATWDCPACGGTATPHAGGKDGFGDFLFCGECGEQLSDKDQETVYANGVVVDGYNRLAIANSLGMEVPVRIVGFDSRDEAKEWVARNQLGRRNLTEAKRQYCIGLLYNNAKQGHGGDRKSSGHSDHLIQKTAEAVAKEQGVSEKTVRRAGEFAESVDVVESAIPGTKEQALAGQIPRANVIEAAKEIKAGNVEGAKEELWIKDRAKAGFEKAKIELKRQNEERAIAMSPLSRAEALVEAAGSLTDAIHWCVMTLPPEMKLVAITEALKALRNASAQLQRRK